MVSAGLSVAMDRGDANEVGNQPENGLNCLASARLWP